MRVVQYTGFVSRGNGMGEEDSDKNYKLTETNKELFSYQKHCRSRAQLEPKTESKSRSAKEGLFWTVVVEVYGFS